MEISENTNPTVDRIIFTQPGNPNTPTCTLREEDFELICDDGRHAPITDFHRCNWGVVPSNAIVTTSAKSKEQRRVLQEFLKVGVIVVIDIKILRTDEK